ncbi:MAG TPA: cytochrome c biogenesis protein CcsA [Fimbriimonadales bacterium]|nr:cytochrome c biogenesis protein CcsA [Fimbriimonadales bacterium]
MNEPLLAAAPPSWTLTIGVLGRLFIYSSAVFSFVSILAWVFAKNNKRLERIGALSFNIGCYSLFGAILSLAVLFVFDRFEFAYVWGHGESANPIPLKIAGVWAGQEGSFLLWAVTSAIFGVLSVKNTGHYRRWYTIVYALFLFALSGILAFETPFALNLLGGQPVVPRDGVGLSPALQNYWVVVHPPVIFLGFGSLTVLFAYSFAAMATRDTVHWIKAVRPWALVSLAFVGAGLCLGGLWAYETLGWGGFWAWDPVENASLVPWIFTAAFVHGVMVQVTRGKWIITNLLLAAMPFLSFMYGTFLTRSGVLSDASVHSFAEMDRTALKLLVGILSAALVAFIALWIAQLFRAPTQTTSREYKEKGLHLEGFYRFGVALLAAIAVLTLVGMSVPLFMALKGAKPGIVEGFVYNRVLVWLFFPLMLGMATAPLVSWRPLPPKEFFKKIYNVVCVAAGMTGITALALTALPISNRLPLNSSLTMLGGYEIGVFPLLMAFLAILYLVIAANIVRMLELFKTSKAGTAPFIVHIGVAVLMAGLIVSQVFEQKTRILIQEGTPAPALFDYLIAFRGHTSNLTNRDNKVLFDITNHKDKFVASPGLYYYNDGSDEPKLMVWPYIERRALYDFYVSVNAREARASQVIPLKPGNSIAFQGFRLEYRGLDGPKENKNSDEITVSAIIEATSHVGSQILKPAIHYSPTKTESNLVNLGKSYQVELKDIDWTDKTAFVQIYFKKPLYSVEIFYKPMTLLVWLGTAIVTFGCLLTAWYRRNVSTLQNV